MKLTANELGQMLASAFSSGGVTAIANGWGFDDREKLDRAGCEYARTIVRVKASPPDTDPRRAT